ncbi:hypothetical protein K435DRAFT_960758 [Dendrothele bispora CBS 962.96]|uniref:DUF6532 domain-containing protein n=1 Tax=Dendrothele bispora (strain CBS 962.96) TaxID=1314807 RepID=A0A4S8MS35_DENBC|nr:hypothetical protein K435DRAFT_960758 [Dendrothele bispora CBS 962.96]
MPTTRHSDRTRQSAIDRVTGHPPPPPQQSRSMSRQTNPATVSGKKRKEPTNNPKNSGTVQPAARKKKAPQGQIQRHRPAIVETESSSEEDIPERPPKRNKHSKGSNSTSSSRITIAEREAQEEDAYGADSGSGDEEMEEDREQDRDAAQFLDMEAPQLMTFDGEDITGELEDYVIVPPSHHRHSRTSSRASVASLSLPSTPPVTDTDGFSSAHEDDGDEQLDAPPQTTSQVRTCSRTIPQWGETGELDSGHQQPQRTRNTASRRTRQLEYELPQVGSTVTPAVQTPPAINPTSTASAATPTTTLIPWLEHTDLTTSQRGRTFTTAMSGQTPEMHKVMEQAIKVGKHKMLLDHTFCPVGQELKQIAFAALIAAAEELGFDGEYDIADRLERGDNDRYIKPLVNYIGQRIGIERSQLKTMQVATVLTAFGFGDSAAGPKQASLLVLSRNYTYPETEAGGYDHRKPFEHPVIGKYIRSMFFGSTLYSGIIADNRDHFTSSIPQKPDELELPKSIVALATAAIHAVLQDYARGCKDNFPTKELEGIWQTAIRILTNLENVNRTRYHKLMHQLYIDTSGALPLAQHGMTNQQIYDTVDWTALAEDVEDEQGVVESAKEHTGGLVTMSQAAVAISSATTTAAALGTTSS